MGTVTNITPDDLECPLLEGLGHGRVIPAGATVDVPDDIIDAYAWPESTWTTAIGAAATAAKAAGAKQAKAGKE